MTLLSIPADSPRSTKSSLRRKKVLKSEDPGHLNLVRRPTAIDLFAGCGGLTYGLRGAGFTVAGAIEIDAKAAGTYMHNHRKVAMRVADIQTVDPRQWMTELGLVEGELDLLAGCPPCQGFSTLRTRNGSKRNRDKRNILVFEMLRFVSVFRPKAVMMENVPGLKDHRMFQDFRGRLKRLGYTVRSTVEDVRYFGVPQRRRRLIMLAGRDIELKFFPRSTQIVTVRDAIGSLPLAGHSGDVLHDYSETRTLRTQALIRRIPRNGGGRLDLPHSDQLRCHQDSDGFKDTYGRMAWDSVSPTILLRQ